MAKSEQNVNHMRIGVMGIVSDQFGSVLAIKRDDSRTWCPPGGTIDAGELPPDGAVREVEEETGLKVIPIRLVGVEYVHYSTIPYLIFVFRCLKRGGEMRTSAESLEVGMVPRKELDNIRMSSFHRARTIDALKHAGETPQWTRRYATPLEQFSMRLIRTFVYPYKNIKQRMKGGSVYVPPSDWDISVSVVITNKTGQTLWTEDGQLPNGTTAPDEAPWTAVEQLVSGVQLVDLAVVYVDEERPQMHLVWLGQIADRVDVGKYVWRDEPLDHDSVWGERWTAAIDPLRGTTQFIRTTI